MTTVTLNVELNPGYSISQLMQELSNLELKSAKIMNSTAGSAPNFAPLPNEPLPPTPPATKKV